MLRPPGSEAVSSRGCCGLAGYRRRARHAHPRLDARAARRAAGGGRWHLVCCSVSVTSAGFRGRTWGTGSCGSTDQSRVFATEHLDLAALDQHAFASRKRPRARAPEVARVPGLRPGVRKPRCRRPRRWPACTRRPRSRAPRRPATRRAALRARARRSSPRLPGPRWGPAALAGGEGALGSEREAVHGLQRRREDRALERRNAAAAPEVHPLIEQGCSRANMRGTTSESCYVLSDDRARRGPDGARARRRGPPQARRDARHRLPQPARAVGLVLSCTRRSWSVRTHQSVLAAEHGRDVGQVTSPQSLPGALLQGAPAAVAGCARPPRAGTRAGARGACPARGSLAVGDRAGGLGREGLTGRRLSAGDPSSWPAMAASIQGRENLAPADVRALAAAGLPSPDNAPRSARRVGPPPAQSAGCVGVARPLKALLPDASGDVVDVGSGAQPYPSAAALRRARYQAIDGRPCGRRCAWARTCPTARSPSRGTAGPSRTDPSTSVLATETLEHVREPAALVAEGRRVLRHGGAHHHDRPVLPRGGTTSHTTTGATRRRACAISSRMPASATSWSTPAATSSPSRATRRWRWSCHRSSRPAEGFTATARGFAALPLVAGLAFVAELSLRGDRAATTAWAGR